jgi:hypothetical protein
MMVFNIYTDLASIAFVRCISRVPNSNILAEGTSFSVAGAIAKCRSEAAEAEYQLKHPLRADMLGIAAHPIHRHAITHAWNESLESLMLIHLANERQFFGITFTIRNTKFLIGRILDRFIAIAVFNHRNQITATQAVSKNPLSALLKSWSEFRNLKIYNPPACSLPSYTKANRYMTQDQLGNIQVSISARKNSINSKNLQSFQDKQNEHHIAYYIQEIK